MLPHTDRLDNVQPSTLVTIRLVLRLVAPIRPKKKVDKEQEVLEETVEVSDPLNVEIETLAGVPNNENIPVGRRLKLFKDQWAFDP